MRKLNNKIAIVTGGANGMGKTTALLFAEEGATVIVADINIKGVEETVTQIKEQGGEAIGYQLDVSSQLEWQALIDETTKRYGCLNVLVNCAGINKRSMLTEMEMEDWKEILDVDLTGVMLGMKTAAQLMKVSNGGSIINFGSIAGIIGHPVTAYSTAKFGVRGLSKSAAMELVDFGIRVNAIHPGFVKTSLHDDVAQINVVTQNIPMGRMAEQIEIARLVLFLASDDSSYITAQDIVIDGGYSELAAYRTPWNQMKKGTGN